MKNILLLLFLFFSAGVVAQGSLNIVSISDFKTSDGAVIKNCKIGYRTVGKLNAGRSNIILWPSWFTGTSQGILNIVPKIIDTTQFYVVLADALGDGISSSPSNTKNFPALTIRDMVNSQYVLLTQYLNIQHVFAVGGISMGAMQTLEWMIAYPTFMDRVISIVGTPRQSFHDLLLWNIEANTISDAEKNGDKDKIVLAMKKVIAIHLMELYTPDYFIRTLKADSLNRYLDNFYARQKFTISDWLIQLRAMIKHDIYKSSGKDDVAIKALIKAKVLIMVAARDQMVSPKSAIDLSKQIECSLVSFDNDCGHNLFDCGTEKVREIVGSFLHE